LVLVVTEIAELLTLPLTSTLLFVSMNNYIIIQNNKELNKY